MDSTAAVNTAMRSARASERAEQIAGRRADAAVFSERAEATAYAVLHQEHDAACTNERKAQQEAELEQELNAYLTEEEHEAQERTRVITEQYTSEIGELQEREQELRERTVENIEHIESPAAERAAEADARCRDAQAHSERIESRLKQEESRAVRAGGASTMGHDSQATQTEDYTFPCVSGAGQFAAPGDNRATQTGGTGLRSVEEAGQFAASDLWRRAGEQFDAGRASDGRALHADRATTRRGRGICTARAR